jgi:hypothetical protein
MGKLFSSMFMVLSGSLLLVSPSGKQSIAQAQQPPCQPPNVGEYLLMVVHQTPDTQATLQETLPRNAVTTVCDYLGSTVTRVSGFTDLEVANSWAQYLSDLGGLQAFVARPASDGSASASPSQSPVPTAVSPAEPASAESFPAPTEDSSFTTEDSSSAASSTAVDLVEPFPTPTQVTPATPTAPSSLGVSPVTPTPSPSNSSGNVAIATSTYNPRPLGAGYAVLVDYGSRPEVAADVRQVVAGQVGVVAYEQRPYLLASYTSDLATAAAVLQQLSDRNFSAILVDSRRTILLAPTVASD